MAMDCAAKLGAAANGLVLAGTAIKPGQASLSHFIDGPSVVQLTNV